MNRKLKKILRENARGAEKNPYLFCDRWCQRCPSNTQQRCKSFLDEFDRRVTNIAHGRDPDDLTVREKDLKQQFMLVESCLDPWLTEGYFDFDDQDDGVDEIVEKRVRPLENHVLQRIARAYKEKTQMLLKEAYYGNHDLLPDEQYHYETIEWYHTLLPTKLYRALCGLYDTKAKEYDVGDAVAQLAICKKAIEQSERALRSVSERYPQIRGRVEELLPMLYRLFSRIKLMEHHL